MSRTEATAVEVEDTKVENDYDYEDISDDETKGEEDPGEELSKEETSTEETAEEHVETANKGEEDGAREDSANAKVVEREVQGTQQTGAEEKDFVAEILDGIPELEDPDDLGEDIKGFHSAVKEGFKKVGDVVKALQKQNQEYRAEIQARNEENAVRELDDALEKMPEFHHVLGATREERLKNAKLKDAVGSKLIPRIQSIAREHQEAGRPIPSLRELTREAAESLFQKKKTSPDDIRNLKNSRIIAEPSGTNTNRKLSGKERAIQRSRALDSELGDEGYGDTEDF